MADACTAKRRTLRPGVRFYHALAAQIICTIIQICNMVLRFFIRTGRGWENPVFFLITGIFFICTVLFGSRIIQLLFPESRFRALGNSVLAALKEAGYITSACQVMTERNREFEFFSWLREERIGKKVSTRILSGRQWLRPKISAICLRPAESGKEQWSITVYQSCFPVPGRRQKAFRELCCLLWEETI